MHFYPDTVNKIAIVLKYVFALATTWLTAYSFTHEATEKGDAPGDRVKLTPAGRKYLLWFVVLALITLSVSIAGDQANLKVSDNAEDMRAGKITVDMKKDLDEKEHQVDQGLGRLQSLEGKLQTNLTQTSIDIDKQLQAQTEQSKRNIAGIEAAQSSFLLVTKAQADKLGAAFDALKAATDDSAGKINAAVATSQKSLEDLTHSVSQDELKAVGEAALRTEEAAYLVKDFSFNLSIPEEAKFKPADPAAAESVYHWSEQLAAMEGGTKSICSKDPQELKRLGYLTCSLQRESVATRSATHLFAERFYLANNFKIFISGNSSKFGFQVTIEDCNAYSHQGPPAPCMTNSQMSPRREVRDKKGGWTAPPFNTAVGGKADGNLVSLMPARDKVTETYIMENTLLWQDLDLRDFAVRVCFATRLPPNSPQRQAIYQQAAGVGGLLPAAFEWDIRGEAAGTGNISVHPFHLHKAAAPDPLPVLTGTEPFEDVCARWSYSNY